MVGGQFGILGPRGRGRRRISSAATWGRGSHALSHGDIHLDLSIDRHGEHAASRDRRHSRCGDPPGSSARVFLASSADPSTEVSALSYQASDSATSPLQRYVSYRVVMENNSETDGIRVNSVTVNYTPFLRTDFEFTGGCGRVDGVGPTSGPPRLG